MGYPLLWRNIVQHLLSAILVVLLGLPALGLPPIVQNLFRETMYGNQRARWLLGGLLVGFLAFHFLRRSRRVRFLRVLLHEHAHLMMALLLGCSPRSISAGEEAGLFQYEFGGLLPKVRAFFITIAPYWISLVLFSPLILFPILHPNGPTRGLLAVLLGVALALPLGEIHPRQTDLKRYGLIPPIMASLWLWGATFVVSIAVANSGSIRSVVRVYAAAWGEVVSWWE